MRPYAVSNTDLDTENRPYLNECANFYTRSHCCWIVIYVIEMKQKKRNHVAPLFSLRDVAIVFVFSANKAAGLVRPELGIHPT